MDRIGHRLSGFLPLSVPACSSFNRSHFKRCSFPALRLARIVFLAGIMAFAAGCGAVSVTYSPLDFDKSALGPKPLRFITADIIDARKYSGTDLVNEKKLDHDLAELRSSVRKQLVVDGLVSSPQAVVAAPKSAADVENILTVAAREKADAALFLRMEHAGYYGQTNALVDLFYACTAACAPLVVVGIVPLCVVSVLPVNKEEASSIVETVAVDPKTRTLLGRFKGEACYSGSSSMWTHDPKGELPDVIGAAVQKALTTAASAAKDGFPGRGGKIDPQAVVKPIPDYVTPKCIFTAPPSDKDDKTKKEQTKF